MANLLAQRIFTICDLSLFKQYIVNQYFFVLSSSSVLLA